LKYRSSKFDLGGTRGSALAAGAGVQMSVADGMQNY
jgi:hypothetical protein